MRRTAHVLLLAGALAGALLPPAPSIGAEVAVKVIAHRSRAAALRPSDLRAIYLKQRRFWNDGQAIVPINREAGSAARERFSERVFGQGSARLAAYWNQRYFEAGEFPPATLASDEAVMRFVATNENAIGYVTLGTVADSVAVVLTLP